MRVTRFSLILLLPKFLCPLGADTLWDNGKHDGRYGFESCREWGWSTPTTWTADDFGLDVPWRVTGATAEFYVNLMGGDPFDTADVAIWEETTPGAKPGRQVMYLKNLPIRWEQVGEGFGLPIILVAVGDLDIQLPPGQYYFSMALVARSGGAWGLSYLCSTENGHIRGWSGGWSWYWHSDRWGRVSDILSTRFWLSTSDFAFKLEGEKQ